MYELRPYQRDALAATLERLKEYRSTLIVMATGLGKTVVFAALSRAWLELYGGRVLVIAHRRELIWQAAEKLEAVLGESVGVEMNRHRTDGMLSPPRVVVASVQTIASDRRIGTFKPSEFTLVIVDEAHHAAAKGYRKVLGYFRKLNPELRVVGVTATPKRHDKLALRCQFESEAYKFPIPDAIPAGWLVDVVQKVVRVDGLDFSEIRKNRGDLSEAELERILSQEKPLHAVAAATHQLAGTRQGIIFAVNVRHAHALAGAFQRERYYPEGQVVALNGKSEDDHRADTIRAFKEGRIQLLVNCGIFLEGFDAPATSLIVMARPTLSTALYEQMMGRGTRPLPGVVDGLLDDPTVRRAAIAASAKPDCLVLDFAGNAGRHRIVTALDVLGGKNPEEVRDFAFRSLKDGDYDAAKVQDALDDAAAELALLEEEDARRRKIAANAVRLTAEVVSPFGGKTKSGPAVATPKAPGQSPSQKMVNFLVKWCNFRPERARSLSHKTAGQIIGHEKQKRGWK